MKRLFVAFAVLALIGGLASAASVSDCWAASPDFIPGTCVGLFTGGDPVGVAGPVVDVPAPGAILLAAIGTALVGWLRRRKTL